MVISDQTFSQLELVLDGLMMLRHLMFGSVTADLLYLVAGHLPELETLCAAAVSDKNTTEHL